MNDTTNIHHLLELGNQATKSDISLWLDHEFLTFKWWILIVLFILPWLIWIKLVDQRRVIEILLFGTIIMIFTSILDSIGNDLSFWSYPIELIPLGSSGYVFDFSLIPVFFMILYQHVTTWKRYIPSLLLFSAIYAFIGEPCMVLFGFVTYVKWKYIYSFLFYVVIGVFIKFLIQKLKEIKL